MKRTNGWEGAGKLWLTLEEAQKAELEALLGPRGDPSGAETRVLAAELLAQSDKIVAILSEKQVGRPRKPRTVKAQKEAA